MAGIFSRLKITDPTAVSSLPLAKDNHPATVPIGFRHIPEYVDRVWDTMEAIGTRPFGQLNLENKEIFKKGVLSLSEVKVCYAQRAHQDKPDEDLPSKKLYNTEELNDFNNMAAILPYPLAIMLECIGNCSDRAQLVTPVLAVIEQGDYVAASGAITYSPRQLLPLLRLLRAGVSINGDVHQLALALADLPGLNWEEYVGPMIPPALEGPLMVRITQRCYDFWVENVGRNGRIRWTDREFRIFLKIIQSMNSKKGFNIATDLSHGQGTLSQVVQVTDWTVGSSTEWFTMTDVDDFNIKLGAAFGFSSLGAMAVQQSRFRGTYTIAFLRGEITPRTCLILQDVVDLMRLEVALGCCLEIATVG